MSAVREEILAGIPLPKIENYSYSEAQKFSRGLDEKLGFHIEAVEQEILREQINTPWAGLDPQALQTPYPEIRMMLSLLQLKPGEAIIDLGAAYGRMGLVIDRFYPGVQFVGYEISSLRVAETLRIFNHLPLFQADISATDLIIPEADVYFIYDFGDLESIVRVIEKLKLVSTRKPIRVVGRGRRTRDHIERHEPWLSQVHAPRHCGNFSIYFS